MVDLIERRRAALIAYRRAITQKPRNWAEVWTARMELCAANAAIASLNTPDQGSDQHG